MLQVQVSDVVVIEAVVTDVASHWLGCPKECYINVTIIHSSIHYSGTNLFVWHAELCMSGMSARCMKSLGCGGIGKKNQAKDMLGAVWSLH